MIIDHHAIAHAAQLLQMGKLVAIPTETVYGLGADALNSSAIQKVYLAKGRPATNPLIIHLRKHEAMYEWAIQIPKAASKLAEAFWPGPLTLILPKHPRVPLCATGNQESVGLRIPNHPVALALLEAFQGGIAAPSANRYGRISPTTSNHVRSELGDKLDFILEGGPSTVGIESTIVSLLGPEPVILRQGGISAENIAEVLNLPSIADHAHLKTTVEVPGQSFAHYAPAKPLYLVPAEFVSQTGRRFNAMGFRNSPPSHLKPHLHTWIQASMDPLVYAHELYANLRTLDEAPGEYILVELPPQHTAWIAILDRLKRASSQRI